MTEIDEKIRHLEAEIKRLNSKPKLYKPAEMNEISRPDGRWKDWTPASQTGWTDIPTGTYRYMTIGKTLWFSIDITAGTSNATSAVLSLPVAPIRRFNGTNGFAVNGGSNLTVASRYFCETNGLIYFYTDMSAGAWTNSGTKRVRTSGFYEAA